jgi:hypothetical protein
MTLRLSAPSATVMLAAAAFLCGACIPVPNIGLPGRRISAGDQRIAPTPPKEYTPAEDAAYLRMPEAGWVAYTADDYDAAASAARGAPLAPANVVCIRAPLKDWEVTDGNFAGSAAVRSLDGWVGSGKRTVGIRIDCAAKADLPASLTALPVPLLTAAPGQPPRFWDADYQDHHQRLVSFLGGKLSATPERLAVVVIGGADWDINADWKLLGLTEDKLEAMVKDFVRMYQTAFPPQTFRQAKYFISYKAVAQAGSRSARLLQYLDGAGVGLLDDARGSGSMPEAWTSGRAVMLGDGYARALDASAAARYRARYMVLAPSPRESQSVCSSRADALNQIGAKFGPRVRVASAVVPANAPYETEFQFTVTLANSGTVAPADNWNFEVAFLDAGDNALVTTPPAPLTDESGKTSQTTQWGPGFSKTFTVTVKAPKQSPGGINRYNLAVALVDPSNPKRRLPLAVADRTKDGNYVKIGTLQVTN